jgi:1-acyl-sn-glycerol-3-phosphate acyltransferase
MPGPGLSHYGDTLMTLASMLVNSTLKRLTRIACNVEDSQLNQVPLQGPLILVFNHVNSLEIPLVYTHLLPRPITGLAKVETWDNPILRPLFNMWGIIPVARGEADTAAMRRSLTALENGNILAIAPEGTRSRTGCLQRGHPGVVLLALRSGAPLMPLAFYGGEKFNRNIFRLRRTDFNILVGKKF